MADKSTYDIIVDVAGAMLSKGALSDFKKWLARAIGAGVALKEGKKLLHWFKSGGFANFLQYIGENASWRTKGGETGFNLAKAVNSYLKENTSPGQAIEGYKNASKGGKVLKIGKVALKAASLLGAIGIASETVKYWWNYSAQDIKSDKSTASKIGSFLWDSSIPGATANMVAGWFGHGRKSGNKKDDSGMQYLKAMSAAAKDYAQGRSARSEYDRALAEATGYDVRGIEQIPTAEKDKLARKVVEKEIMKIKTNDPTWYWRGLAEKLVAGSLTWTSVRSNYAKLPLVAFTVADIKLHFPMIDGMLPTKVITNFDALFGALRGPNTGAYNYTSEDVFVYTMELASLITRIKYLQKIIKMAHTHAVEQDDLAKIGVKAMTQSSSWYNEIITDGPSRIARLNALAEEINKWPLVGMSLMSRWNYLADKCFKDYSGPKAIFGSYRISKMPGFDSTSGSHFSYKGVANSAGLNAAIADLENEYTAFKSWSGVLNHTNTMLLIAGDFIKLLGTEKSVFNNVSYLDQTQPGKLTFDYDQEAQFQMQNAKLAGRSFASSNVPAYFNQSVATPLVYYVTTGNAAPTTLPMEYDKTQSWIVVNDSDRVRSSANNIEMCQFVWNGDVTAYGTTGIQHSITDVSVATYDFFHIYYYTTNGSGGATADRPLCGYFNIQSATTYDSYITYEQFIACRQIDYLPSPVLTSGSGASTIDRGRYIDVDNYAEITAEQARNYILVGAYSMTYTYSMEDVEAKRKVKA